MSRRLVVLRHAKAQPGAASDHERVLTGRGRRDALAVGRWLAGAGVAPDLTICSTAARATQTWALAAIELGDGIPTSYDRAVYNADLDRLLAVLRDVPGKIATLVLVGHNPAVHELVLALAGSVADDAAPALREGFGTSAVAVLDLPATWVDIAPGQGTLASMAVVRG